MSRLGKGPMKEGLGMKFLCVRDSMLVIVAEDGKGKRFEKGNYILFFFFLGVRCTSSFHRMV